mmetsp:Transcript_24798/g.59819  ORF Transcript_24798/g.59819 Transcript_24798/m.59819 type:complete len:255 (-) Transcript_24798:410-1174(-)
MIPKLAPISLLLSLLIAAFLCLATQPHAAAAATKNNAPPPAASESTTTTMTTASISGRLRHPDPDTTINSTRITLNDGSTHSTYTQVDGSFVFHRVPPGVHLLDVQSREHHFSQVKIQLLDDSMDSPKCIEYAYPGAPKQAIPHPLELVAHASYEYYEPRQGFSLASIFKNPMMLMMLVSVGGMVLMPKMMEGLDPDQKEQMQKQMAMQQDPSKMLTQMFQDMTGTGEEPTAHQIEKKQSSKAGGKTARRGKRD